MTERGGRYLFHVVEELEKRDMPTELALLPFIESAFNPQAMSVARAVGHVAVHAVHRARTSTLKQNVFRDDRRDVLASTRAALDYLQKLQRHVRRLAARAGRLQLGRRQRAARASQRNQQAGNARPTTRACGMPDETRDYVPKLQAVKNIVADPQAFGLTLPALENHPYFLSVPIERDIDVELAAQAGRHRRSTSSSSSTRR